jgi:NAD(P)-dependent dehydrogenase (short-subunit alcohol dehydrogenase family)
MPGIAFKVKWYNKRKEPDFSWADAEAAWVEWRRVLSMNNENKAIRQNHQRLIVITGCDSGIGKSLAAIMAKRGYLVVISYLSENPFADERGVFAVKMDLRIPEEVGAFISYIRELCSGGMELTAVVGNAGVALGGPVEDIPMGLMRESFEINYFGMVKIVQAMIPELIRTGGRIVVNGSLAGRIAMPYMAPYTASKFALEGYCDSLRRELFPYGVPVVLLEPSAVATPIWDKAKKQDISFVEEKYLKSLNRFRDSFIEDGNRGMETGAAAERIAEILTVEKPKARYIIAKQPIRSKLLCLLPAFILDRAIVKMLGMNK